MTFPALYSTYPGGGALLPPGDWIITAVEPLAITITIPERWYKGLHDWAVFPDPENSPSVAFMAVDNLYVDPCDTTKGLLEPVPGPSVDDLAAAMSAVPGLDAPAPTDVTLAGYSGKRLELSRPADAQPRGGGAESVLWPVVGDVGEDAPAPEPGDSFSYSIVDVNGTRLVVAIYATGSTTRLAEAEAIVDSIRIEP